MKTDKELLELAAKACGFNVKAINLDQDDNFYGLIIGKKNTRERIYWNPLFYNEDALRLSAKMEISINHFDSFVKAQACFEGCAGRIVTAMIERGRLDAMRRAIVLAAAAIGESK